MVAVVKRPPGPILEESVSKQPTLWLFNIALEHGPFIDHLI